MTDLTVAQCVAPALQRHGVDVIQRSATPERVLMAGSKNKRHVVDMKGEPMSMRQETVLAFAIPLTE